MTRSRGPVRPLHLRARRAIRRRLRPGAAAGVFYLPHPDDTMLVSYPRSGSTWMRCLLAAALDPGLDLQGVVLGDVVPDIYQSTEGHLRSLPRPLVVKSHQPPQPGYGRALLLVRHPADVVVSYHRYLRLADYPVTDDPAAFAREVVVGPAPLPRFDTWPRHTRAWLDRGVPVVRYEDLLADPERGLGQALDALGLTASAAAIRGAAQRVTPATLRAIESAQPRHLRSHVGAGGRGTGLRTLDDATLALLRRETAELTDLLGYEVW
ncbi:sulfotransferase domain-containing protein [Nocardioides sp. TRM66260-LWL]|uniref:sulfotransferase domain-containing protein n=1 Tax=Nocardioides sp. TRM66260-LWL TaxID=2874478 RepID=UPI001CC4DBDC|nr:sulfotransferase domain-containing protein [Nocardioides sp. TRM66260-LWL]MBZ5734978.1 sulfotransferase domain-containing protein [Nocardioides sp. TRM66260-LWL]